MLNENYMHSIEKKSGAKMAPQWKFLEKWFHFVKVEPFFPLEYLKRGHPVDMKMGPLWSHFGSTFFFQCLTRKPMIAHTVRLLISLACVILYSKFSMCASRDIQFRPLFLGGFGVIISQQIDGSIGS